ncbi:MAG: hypothetical protein JW959_02530, partial [Pirellulales bacterium]|nr:hypothetical protein [Pirellulales bacterium]
MGRSDDWTVELESLLERLIDGGFDAANRSRLNVLLAQGTDQRRYYRGYMRLHHGLEWRHGAAGIKPIDLPIPLNVEEVGFQLPLLSLSPISSPLSPSFVGGPVFSYMVATVVLCLMLLGGW